MKVGAFVKLHISKVFDYCENNCEIELVNLMDKAYSKESFNINFPFCTELALIPSSQSSRYWKDQYQVQGKVVRVSSQWYLKDKGYFKQYLLRLGLEVKDSEPEIATEIVNVERVKKGRYKGKAIGDAQNALIRNILGNLGEESFNRKDWERAKEYFNGCVYCDSKEASIMEHAIPINKDSLGEHRLGNLVPSCKSCNQKKGDKDFREFLGDNEEKVSRIEKHMERQKYIPLEKDNEQIEKILEMARQDVLAIANRYATLLNELFINKE